MKKSTADAEKLLQQQQRAKTRALMEDNYIEEMADINQLFKKMIGSVFLNGLDAKL